MPLDRPRLVFTLAILLPALALLALAVGSGGLGQAVNGVIGAVIEKRP